MSIFEDDPHAVLLEGARVFIGGVEVTARLTSGVTTTKVGRGGWGQANFSLSNANDGFILTEENLAGNFRLGGNLGEYSELIKAQMWAYKTGDRINGKDARTGTRRWPLFANGPVLHAFDPVFVVESWPYTKEELWIPRFKGYIESKPCNEDWVTGQSSMQVTCVDLRAIMARMRVQMNYLIGNIYAVVTDSSTGEGGDEETLNALDPIIQDGLFADLQMMTTMSTPLAGLTLKDTIEFLITGQITDIPEFSIPGYSNDARQEFLERLKTNTVSTRGVGQMKPGVAVSYPVSATGDTAQDVRVLEEWHRLTLFGIPGLGDQELPADLGAELGLSPGQQRLLALNARPWTSEEVLVHGANCTWDGPTAPHAMSLHYLLPSTEGGLAGVVSYTQDSMSPERRWQTRLSLIEDYLEVLDFHWTVTPVGDVVVEFPMYDFTPARFGEWEEAFTVRHHGQGKNLSFEDDRPVVPTAMIVTAGYNPDIEVRGGLVPATINENVDTVLRVVLQAPVLAARIGQAVETYTMPFALDDICRLRQFAVMRFQLRLAEQGAMSVGMVYRPLLLPNRPLLETGRERMGWVSEVTHSCHAGRPREQGIASTTVALKYTRWKEEDGIYRLLTGSEFLPMSYTGKGIGMDPSRGILINDRLSIEGPCGAEAAGAPPVDYTVEGEEALIEDPAEDCSVDPADLAPDVAVLWDALRNEAQSRYLLTLDLTCTHRSGEVEDNHPGGDLHLAYPARAFDISITTQNGKPGETADYERVGALGQELGLIWGGSNPSAGGNVSQQRAKAVAQAQFHVSHGTPYIFGGAYDAAHFKGVDCSGLIVDCYREAGIMRPCDPVRISAQMEAAWTPVETPQPGDVAFFGASGCTHVVMIEAFNGSFIGASGGSQSCTTPDIATAKNAKVKRLPWASYLKIRTDFRGFATLFDDKPTTSLNHFSA